MKITFTPTEPYEKFGSPGVNYSTVSVEIPANDLSFVELLDCLIIPAVLGLGYQSETINKYIPE